MMQRTGIRRFTEACTIVAAALLLAILPARAQTEMVDVALVLAVDVSQSVNDERFALQMEGIAKAFEDPEVQRSLFSGYGVFASYLPSERVSIALATTFRASSHDAQGNLGTYWTTLPKRIGRIVAPRAGRLTAGAAALGLPG